MNITLLTFLNHLFCILALYIPETTLLEKPFSKRNHIIYVILLAILCFIPLFVPIHNSILIFISILAIGALTERHLINMIIALIGYIAGVCYNYISLSLYNKFTGVSQAELVKSMFHSMIFYILYFSTMYFLLRLFKGQFSMLQKADTSQYKSLAISLFLYLVICALIYVINFTYEEAVGFPDDLTVTNQKLFLVFFIFTAILLCVIIINIYRNSKAKEALKEMEYLKKYTYELEELYYSVRGFRHDYTNILYSMKNYIDTENYDSLKKYYNTNIIPIVESIDSGNPTIQQLANMKIPELKSILYLKIIAAEKLNIPVSLEIKWPIDSINMQPVDLTRVMGIFLDNAIESVSNIPVDDDKFINLAYIKQDNDTIIIISNPSTEKAINLSQIKKRGISSKGSNRGIGLSNVNEILKKYPNILMTTEYKDNVFTQTLEISC